MAAAGAPTMPRLHWHRAWSTWHVGQGSSGVILQPYLSLLPGRGPPGTKPSRDIPADLRAPPASLFGPNPTGHCSHNSSITPHLLLPPGSLRPPPTHQPTNHHHPPRTLGLRSALPCPLYPPACVVQDPKDRDRVDRECRVMRNLSNHVAVVKLFEYVETRDFVYIMMEAAKRG